MAAPSPAAVAISASDIPGATTARLADPCDPMPLNDSMTPQTVPKSPINGAVLAVVARIGKKRSILEISRTATWRIARDADSRREIFISAIAADCVSLSFMPADDSSQAACHILANGLEIHDLLKS